MLAPIYANGVEIKTVTADKKPASLVVLRFLYTEMYRDKDQKEQMQTMPVVTILLPRQSAKNFMKKFYSLMSVEDEYPNENF